jgi:hypothetical protein
MVLRPQTGDYISDSDHDKICAYLNLSLLQNRAALVRVVFAPYMAISLRQFCTSGYKFNNYARVGPPLTLLLFGVLLVNLALFWNVR